MMVTNNQVWLFKLKLNLIKISNIKNSVPQFQLVTFQVLSSHISEICRYKKFSIYQKVPLDSNILEDNIWAYVQFIALK